MCKRNVRPGPRICPKRDGALYSAWWCIEQSTRHMSKMSPTTCAAALHARVVNPFGAERAKEPAHDLWKYLTKRPRAQIPRIHDKSYRNGSERSLPDVSVPR